MRVPSLVAVVSVLAVMTVPPSAAGQSGKYSPPRTADGKPDLQGTFTFATITPLQRPAELAGKAVLTPEEAAKFEKSENDRLNRDLYTPEKGAPSAGYPPQSQGGVLSYNDFWYERGDQLTKDKRTSLIIDPPDGRVPPLTPAARAKVAARRARIQSGPADNPEDRPLQERCLVFGAGPPLLPGPYNNNMQIVQTPGTLVVLSEMIHDARIVALDGRPAPPAAIRFWLGSSRGHWDGDTLTVETTNFADAVSFRGSDEQLRIVERFTLDGPDALRYEFTIDDPTAFTQPWKGTFTMTRTSDKIYEFACHEGNYGLMNILGAARAEEQEAARKR
jgi:hypothetical protein